MQWLAVKNEDPYKAMGMAWYYYKLVNHQGSKYMLTYSYKILLALRIDHAKITLCASCSFFSLDIFIIWYLINYYIRT